jgi:integrase/recombinase XerC
MAFLHPVKYKTKSGKITRTYYIYYRDYVTGRMNKKSTGQKLLKDADIFFRDWLNNGKVNSDSNLYLSELFNEIIKYVSTSIPQSLSLYKTALKNFLRIVTDKRIKVLNMFDIEKFKQTRIKENVSIRTVNKELSNIKAAFNKAVQIGLLKDHSFHKIAFIKGEIKQERIIFTSEQNKLAISNINDEMIRRVIIIAINTGMRLNEIVSLQNKDIDLQERIIKIRNKPEIKFFVKTYKEREIPISDSLYSYFMQWIGQLNNPEHFIVNHNGCKYDKNTICKKASKELKKIGINGTLHNFRHTFASQVLQRGADINTVMKLLGHTKISTTSIYLHTDMVEKRKAVNLIEV